MKNKFTHTILALSLLCAGSAQAQNTNPGFEAGLEQWTVPATFAEQISIEKQTVRSGNQALRIDADKKQNSPFAVMVLQEAAPGVNYRFSVWARVAPGSLSAQAALKYELYNAQGVNNGGDYSNQNLPTGGDWKLLSILAKPEKDTVSMRFYLRVFGKSTLLFDDATLEVPALTITHPIKSTIEVNKPVEIKYHLVLGEAWTQPTRPEFEATLTSTDGNVSAVFKPPVRKLDSRQFQATVRVPILRGGDYSLQFSLLKDGKKVPADTPATLFTTVPNRKPEYLTETGTLLHNGKPFFPIGMYHPVHGPAYGLNKTTTIADDYKLLAENGFNAIQGNTVTNLTSFGASLDLAHKHGLAVDVPLYNAMQVAKNMDVNLEAIRRFGDHPAILSWKIIDEPDLQTAVAHEVPQAYRTLKQATSKHPIELTLDREVSLAFWSHYCDIVQIDRYPVPGRPLTLVSDFTREAYLNKQPWQNLQFVLQSGWTPDLKTQPTPAQARSMAYLALIEGAKGIWWYSMYDPGWDLTRTPLWPHLKTINAELTQLGQPIMLGKTVEGIASNNPKLHFRAFEHEKKTYLLVTNPHEEPVQATLTLPENLRLWHPLNSDVGSLITDHKMPISLQAIDSRTFVIEE